MMPKLPAITVSSSLLEQWTFLIKLNVSISWITISASFSNLQFLFTAGCKTGLNQSPSLNAICDAINPDQQLITFFAENFVPVNCRSGLEGVWQFAYQNRFRFTGECNHPGNVIQSCQTPGSQFLITNQKFAITYKKCEGMSESLDGSKFSQSILCMVQISQVSWFIHSRRIQLLGRLVHWKESFFRSCEHQGIS